MKISAPQRKVLKIHFVIFIGYIIVCSVYYFYHHDLRLLVENKSNRNIADSFSASMAHTLFVFIFALVVSCITVMSTINDPKDGEFNTRVKALANSDKIDMDDRLYEYLKQHLSQSLAFNKTAKITFEIKDYNEEENAFLIFVESKQIISNMCKDNEFYHSSVIAWAKGDASPNGDYGTVLHLGTFNANTGISKHVSHRVFKIDRQFDERSAVRIDKNEELGWHFQYIIWSKTGDIKNKELWFEHKFSRYTRTIEIEIKNSLTKNVKANIRYAKLRKSPTDKIEDLEKNDNSKYIYTYFYENKILESSILYPVPNTGKIDYYPEDRIELFIENVI